MEKLQLKAIEVGTGITDYECFSDITQWLVDAFNNGDIVRSPKVDVPHICFEVKIDGKFKLVGAGEYIVFDNGRLSYSRN